MSQIGFIGLGNMGLHMARNLLTKGHKLVVHDLVKSSSESLKELGAKVAENPRQIAQDCKEIVTMLPSSPHVSEVYTGAQGIFESIQPDTLCLDSSTIDPAVSKQMGALAQERKATYMDCPVSGGVVAASNGQLTFMIAGDEKQLPRAENILKDMAKTVVYCGDTGNGQAAKICNNMLLAISMIGLSETMNLGQKLGLDPQMLAKILNSSSGRCWSSDTYNPVPGIIEGVPSGKNYDGGFGTALMTKDLGLAQGAATNCGAPTPLGSLAHQLYRVLSNDSNFAAKDFSIVYQWLKNSPKT